MDNNQVLIGANAVVRGPAKGHIIGHGEEVGVFVPLSQASIFWPEEAVRLRVERAALRVGIEPAPPAAEEGAKAFINWWATINGDVEPPRQEEPSHEEAPGHDSSIVEIGEQSDDWRTYVEEDLDDVGE